MLRDKIAMFFRIVCAIHLKIVPRLVRICLLTARKQPQENVYFNYCSLGQAKLHPHSRGGVSPLSDRQ